MRQVTASILSSDYGGNWYMGQLGQPTISGAADPLIHIAIIIDHQQRVQEGCDDARSFRKCVLKKTRDRQTYPSSYRATGLASY